MMESSRHDFKSSKLKSSLYPKLRNKLSNKNRLKSQPEELKETCYNHEVLYNSVSSSFERNASELEHLPETIPQSEEHTLKLSDSKEHISSDNKCNIKIISDKIFEPDSCNLDNLNACESLISDINGVKNVDQIGESIQENTNKEICDTPGEVMKELNNPDIKHTVEDDYINYSSDHTAKKYCCPLCWKKFENSESQISHMKVCAVKHNVTSQQLLDAVELHARQTTERQALGLPDISNVQPVQKCKPRKNIGKNDDNLQLALALSASIQEAEEVEHFQQNQCLLEADLDHEVVEQQKNILEKFVNTNSCPSMQALRSARSKQNKNNRNIASELMSRTREEREKSMAEMVAMILMEDENKSVEDAQDTIHCSNKHLYQDKLHALWDMASAPYSERKYQSYYVKDLSNFVLPNKMEVFNDLEHQSQAPGTSKTPERRSNTLYDGEFCYSTPSTPLVLESTHLKSGMRRELKKIKYRENHTSVLSNKSTSQISFTKRLINDWKALLNNKFMSDLTIYVENDGVIPAHKLVLYARCQVILKDVVSEVSKNKKKDMLIWIDLSFSAALAFLQFLYCGLTSKILCLNEEDLLSVRRLTQKYRVTELLEHLKTLDSVRFRLENTKNGSSISLPQDETICNSVHLTPLLKHPDRSQHKLMNCGNSVSSKTSDSRQRGDFTISYDTTKQSQQHGSTSPDLFIENTEMNKVLVKTSEENKNNLKYLLNLIGNSLSQSINQTVTGRMTLDKDRRSPEISSPVRGSHIASSPELQCTHPSVDITCDKQDKCDSLTPPLPFLKPKISSSNICTDASDTKETKNSIDKHEIYQHLQEDIHIKSVSRKDFQENVLEEVFDKSDFQETLSESPIKVRGKQTSVETKRKHSGNTSSDCCSPFSKKSCREDAGSKISSSDSYFCRETVKLKNFTNEAEMLDLTQCSNDSPCGEPLDVSSLSSSFVKNMSCNINNDDAKCDAETFNTADTVKNSLDTSNYDKSEIVANNIPILSTDNMNKEVDRANVKLPVNNLVEDDWDVFDEMCALEPKIFSQCLTQLISRELNSKTTLSSEVSGNESHKPHNSYQEEQNLSFIAQLNESLFWRDENAPALHLSPKLEMIMNHEDITDNRTPKQERKNTKNSNEVTPFTNYSSMNTPQLKKELRKYGLKPSLTKKQAKIMLRYIYEQLHPFITGSDSDDSVDSFKGLPVTTPGLDVCVPNNTEKNEENLSEPVGCPARRNILASKVVPEKSYSCKEICNKSPQCSRSSESELPLSQETSCSSLPSVSEEAFCEDNEYFSQQDTAPVQDECSSEDLASSIKDNITSNSDLHQKVLLYNPIWFEDVCTEMKTNKINFKVNHLMDYLDEQCITVRISKGQQNRQKKKLKQVAKKQKMKRINK